MAEPFVSTPLIASAASSPLAGHLQKGTFGNSATGAGVILSERFNVAICDVAAWPGASAKAITAMLSATGLSAANTCSGTAQMFCHAPGRWTIISEDEAVPAKLAKSVRDNATVVDLSHGRTVIRIEGGRAGYVLAKLFAIDFVIGSFPVGQGLATSHHAIFAQIQRVRDDAFDLVVYRSYARSFWHTLTRAAEETGYIVE